MSSVSQGAVRPTAAVRAGVMAASLAVAACFGAAAALADEPAPSPIEDEAAQAR